MKESHGRPVPCAAARPGAYRRGEGPRAGRARRADRARAADGPLRPGPVARSRAARRAAAAKRPRARSGSRRADRSARRAADRLAVATRLAGAGTRRFGAYSVAMPRSIWTGAISFGLVTVPVKLYSAVSKKTVRFHQLNGKTGVRIQQKRVDPTTGDEVPYEDIVKGYELTPDRYVLIEPGELEALDPKKTKSIEIEDFVALDDIDPIYYDHPYYLAPGPGGAKPYRLLLEAMRETGRVAIATVVIRSKQQLVAVRPIGDHALGMATMVFPDEVIDPATIDEIPSADDVTVNSRELAIAEQLVES